MKKLFTLAIALLGFAGIANAASIDDLQVCKHSYVFVADENSPVEEKILFYKNTLFGDGYIFTPTSNAYATNKGSVDLSVADGILVTEDIAAKYGEYGKHLNCLRLKKAQDVIAMRLTAQSKVIIFYQDNSKDDRYPVFATDAGLSSRLGEGVISERCSGEEGAPAANLRRIEWTATDDGLVYIGDNNGDMYLSFIIVEAKEAPGTPTVKVGEQKFEDGLWFREVTCKANPAVEGGESLPTVVTYTTDGSEPTAKSALYTAPIKCYQDMTVKFQAFYDYDGNGKLDADDEKADGADNEGIVSFLFNAPTIDADGANVTFTSEYEGAKNYFSLNGGEAAEGNSTTLAESAIVSAYSQIVNGTYATFTTKSSTKDVYVLNPIKEKKTIAVTAGTAVVDEEATATSTTGTVYMIDGGAISADKKDFFVKNLTFGTLASADAAKSQYQVPAGQEAYIQMSNTNITFFVAEGDSVTVKVICSKNSCKNLDAADAAEDKLDNGCTPDRQCYVNINGTNYCLTDAEGNHTNDLKLYPEANVFEFGLKGAEGGSYFTFQKYSGTGNILISSIEITPAAETPVLADFADGNYYLLNVSSEKAWGAGNSWGTQGSLVKHPEYVTLHKQENGTYFMETQVSNGGENYYFGGEYMDGAPAALTIIQGKELGKDNEEKPIYVYYVTVDSTNFYGWDGTENTVLARNLAAGDEKAQWIIVPADKAVSMLADAAADDPSDATFLLLDPNFGRNNRNVNAWTGDTFNVGGDNTNMNAEKWGGNSQTFDISQTVDAPNGKYKITWNGFYRYNNTADNTNDIAVAAHADGTEVINSFVYINGKDYALTSIADDAASAALEGKLPFSQGEASAAFAQGLYAQSAEVIVTDGKLTIGIKKTNHTGTDWTVWDNFEIMYYGPASDEPADPNNLVKNWNCSGSDASSFWVHEWRTNEAQTDGPAILADGAAKVYVRSFAQAEAAGNATLVDGSKPVAADNFADWDSQFFITWDEAKATAAGDKLQLKMKVKADKAQTIASQLHKAPGAYVHWYCVGDINVTTDWTEFVSSEVDVVTGDPGWGKTAEGCWTIAFNLAKGEENTIYFDDMVVYVIKPTGITEMHRVVPADGVRYNLEGRKVDANYKGIVIVNGKKVLNK